MTRCMRLQALARRHRKLQRVRRSMTHQVSKLGLIYTLGAKPAVSYGAAVQGFSNHELHRVRVTLLQATQPRRGASLRLRLAVLGDPAWGPALAPALMWVSLLWKASSPCATASPIGVKELRDLWLRAEPQELRDGWAKSIGPMRRAVCGRTIVVCRSGWWTTHPA